MRYIFWSIFICLSIVSVKSQTSTTDSIFARFNLKYSPEVLRDAKLEYEKANDTIKAVMEKYYSLPMSSRAELIENYNTHQTEIMNLVDYFKSTLPTKYKVSVEINMDQGPLKYIRSIDMQVFKKRKDGSDALVKAEWDMKYMSAELDTMLNIVQWDLMTFSGIKNLMQVANCISIQNNDGYTEVGYARSGLGKYSYLIFPQAILTTDQIKRYNDGCEYKYLTKNIVLKYEGGMVGPQCFTD